MYSAAKEKGSIATLPETKGLIVWKKGHVGVYIGNGKVIESHGTKYGVIKTSLTKTVNDTKWTNWFKCPYIDYVNNAAKTYVVQKGDTLWAIAERVLGDGSRYVELATLNGISDPNKIHIGQELKIDGVQNDTRTYKVQAGDSPWRIARELLNDGRRYVEIVQMNGIKVPYIIYPGQTLKIPNE